jgi:hypothetical protein
VLLVARAVVRYALCGTNEKALLRTSLQEVRDAMVWKLDGLSAAEVRRPMTPTGTNLLGLVKHLAGSAGRHAGGPVLSD